MQIIDTSVFNMAFINYYLCVSIDLGGKFTLCSGPLNRLQSYMYYGIKTHAS